MNEFLSKYFVYYPITIAKGENVGFHLKNYRKNQFMDRDQLYSYQREKLEALFTHTLKYSSYYSELLRDPLLMLRDGVPTGQILKSIPCLTKQDLISNSDRIATYRKYWSGSKTTGGSTGEPVKLLKNPDALARERAATWRAYEWAGVSVGDKQARFWGVPHSANNRRKSKAIDFLSNRMRLSAFDLTEESLFDYYNSLIQFKPAYLYGYVSVVFSLAQFILDNKLPPPPSVKAVITTSEVLTHLARRKISEVLGVKVFNEYGCGEVGSIAHECTEGGMHIMADNLILELDGAGESGEIVVTDLFNRATPLIRYRLGDYATIDNSRCACGISLPMLKGVHGRAYDIITTSDGRKLHPESIMYIFEDIQKKQNSFRQFQVIQKSHSLFTINVVPMDGWNIDTEAAIVDELQRNISGDVRVDINLVKQIPREKSGKMRVVKSELSDM